MRFNSGLKPQVADYSETLVLTRLHGVILQNTLMYTPSSESQISRLVKNV